MNTNDTHRYQVALSRILQVVSTAMGRGLMYMVAALGMAALAPGVELPSTLGLLASGLGVNLMATIIDRVAYNDRVSDEEIIEQIESLLSEIDIEHLLTKDEFWHAFSHLRKEQRSMDEKLDAIFQTLQHIERTNSATSSEDIQVPFLVKKAIRPVGRKNDIANITRILGISTPRTQVLVLYGLRGIGKSTLAEMTCEALRSGFRSVKRYYLHKNFDLTALYYWLRELIPPKELLEQGYQQFARAVALEIATQDLLLILDGSEVLTDPATDLIASEEIGFSELLDALLTTDLGSSRVIITGWRKFNTMSGMPIQGYHVEGLKTEESIQLLHEYNVIAPHDALTLAAQKTRGHPQALIWLAALLSPPSMYTVELACSEEGIWNPEHGEVAKKILDKVFVDSLSEIEKSVLNDLWVFDELVPADAICYFNQSKRSNSDVYRALNILAHKAMLTISDDKRTILDDLVRDYVSQRINNQQERHSKAADWYLSLPRRTADEWRSREDASITLRAIHHLTFGQRQTEAMNIIKDKRGIGAKLTFFGMHTERIQIVENLLNPNISGPWSLTLYDKGWLMRLAGFSYAALGDYNRGQKLIEEALQIFLSPEILVQHLGPDNLAVCLNSLGKIALWQGHHSKAVEYHEQALTVCQKYRVFLPEVITYSDIAEAKVYGYYEARNEILLHEAIEWADKVISYPQQNIDSIVRVQACRSEALAWLGNHIEAIGSALNALELSRDAENLYSRIQALRAIAISSTINEPELSILALTRAQQLCTQFQYLYGQARNQEIIQYTEEPLQVASLIQEKGSQYSGVELDDLITQKAKYFLKKSSER